MEVEVFRDGQYDGQDTGMSIKILCEGEELNQIHIMDRDIEPFLAALVDALTAGQRDNLARILEVA